HVRCGGVVSDARDREAVRPRPRVTLTDVHPHLWPLGVAFGKTRTPDIYTLSLHDALPIWLLGAAAEHHRSARVRGTAAQDDGLRSEEHTSELQSRGHLVWRLLLEKKKRRARSAPIRPSWMLRRSRRAPRAPRCPRIALRSR